jgi:hypothetical protein
MSLHLYVTSLNSITSATMGSGTHSNYHICFHFGVLMNTAVTIENIILYQLGEILRSITAEMIPKDEVLLYKKWPACLPTRLCYFPPTSNG